MITLYGFGTIFREGHGETKDLWAQWVLEETGLPYRVHALDHTGGETNGDAFGKISPFRQAPVIDDDGMIVAESAAIALYLANKSGRLIPADAAGKIHVMQWCFAAVGTIAPTLIALDLVAIFDGENAKLKTEIETLSARWLGELERRLDGREWIASDDFTVADIMMSGVLRNIRNTPLMDPFPRVKAYHARCHARPAWQRTLELYAERLGIRVDAIV